MKYRFLLVMMFSLSLIISCNGHNKTTDRKTESSESSSDIKIEPDTTDTVPPPKVELPPPPLLSTKAAKLPKGTEVAIIELADMGNIELQLHSKEAPLTVANFEKMVGYGLYDGLAFYRAYLYAFIAAGNPDEKGILIYDRLEHEPTVLPCRRGSICMARLILEDEPTKENQQASDKLNEGKKAEAKKTKVKKGDKIKTQKINYGEVSPTEFFVVLDDANGKFWNDDFCVFATVITGIDKADKISEMVDWARRSRKKTVSSKDKISELKPDIKIKRVTIQWVGETRPPIIGNPSTIPNYGAIPTLPS